MMVWELFANSLVFKLKKSEANSRSFCKLSVTVEVNPKTEDFLEIFFDLTKKTFKPYRKPYDSFVYININSNLSLSIIKEWPKSISRHISNISLN